MIAPDIGYMLDFTFVIIGVGTVAYLLWRFAGWGFKWLCRLNSDRQIGKQVRTRKLGHAGIVIAHDGTLSVKCEYGALKLPESDRAQRKFMSGNGLITLDKNTGMPLVLCNGEWRTLAFEGRDFRASPFNGHVRIDGGEPTPVRVDMPKKAKKAAKRKS